MERDARVLLDGRALQALFDRVSNWGRWGPDDQQGTTNYLTDGTRVGAFGLVCQGRTLSLAWPLATAPAPDNPLPAMHLMMRAGDMSAVNPATTDYLALAPHGLSTTHLDAPCHYAWHGQLYNGLPAASVASVGAAALTVETYRDGLVGRGVLLDLPRHRGVDWLEPGEAAVPDELTRAAEAAGVQVQEADILLVRTGRAARRQALGPWDPAIGMAGLHPEVALWLSERRVAVLGTDAVADALPSLSSAVPFPLHALTLAGMGMPLLDNLQLEELASTCAASGRWHFLFVALPLRIGGGTGSPLNPIACF